MKLVKLLRHYFVPHYSNNQEARLLHNEILLFIAVAIVGFQALIGFGANPNVGVLGYAANISIQDIVTLTNQKRNDIGVGQLTLNPTLSEAARQKGEDMLAQNYWAHVGPDGTEPWDFFANVGYTYQYAGENLARDFSDSGSAVEAWMASTSHRDNLLSDKYEEIGVAVVEGDLNGADTTIIVQLFGKRSEKLAEVPSVAAAENDNSIVPVANAQEDVIETEDTTVINEESETEPAGQAVVSNQKLSENQIPTLSPFIAAKSMSMFVIGILSIVLVIDIIEVERRGVSRVSGRKTAHLAYLLTLIIILIVSKAGEIL